MHSATQPLPLPVLSLFANNGGAKLFAARGKVLMQAQSDAMNRVHKRYATDQREQHVTAERRQWRVPSAAAAAQPISRCRGQTSRLAVWVVWF